MRVGESGNGEDISVFLKSFLLLLPLESALLSEKYITGILKNTVYYLTKLILRSILPVLLFTMASGKGNLFRNFLPNFALGFEFSESSSWKNNIIYPQYTTSRIRWRYGISQLVNKQYIQILNSTFLLITFKAYQGCQ